MSAARTAFDDRNMKTPLRLERSTYPVRKKVQGLRNLLVSAALLCNVSPKGSGPGNQSPQFKDGFMGNGSSRACVVEALEGRTFLATDPAPGFLGAYYNNTNFSGKSVWRIDKVVNFDWGTGSPDATKIDADTFSARYTGRLKAPTSETYTFYVTSDDGARLWINHQLIINDWKSHPTTTNKGTITLTAGKRYDLLLEYFDNTGSANVALKWQTATRSKATVPSSAIYATDPTVLTQIDHGIAFAQDQLARSLTDFGKNTTQFPMRSNNDGTWLTVTADDWTSGYFGGNLWEMYALTGKNTYWKDKATIWTNPLASQKSQPGDHASRLLDTFLPLYNATGDANARQVLLDAAVSKNAQWNETVGAFRTVGITSTSGDPKANFGVLMDQTADLELMFWAAKQTNNTTYYSRAVRHAENVLNHLVRPDGTTIQRGYFVEATGQFISGETYQGYSNTSTWSRGQSWAILDFPMIYRETGKAEFLAAAKKVTDWWLAHVPSDGVPYWDFNDPKIPNTYRDSSAAAIAACGMLDLSKILKTSDPTGSAKYRAGAEKILSSLLSTNYLTEGTASRGIITHGAQIVPKNKGVDTALIFGDYHVLQAIDRYRNG
jgi:hypothetical protein